MSEILEFKVEGMSCGGCSSKLEKALLGVPGIREVKASHETGAVQVSLSDPSVPKATLETVIEETGFDVVHP